MFVRHEIGTKLTTRHAHHEVVAEAMDRVVPTVGDRRQGQRGEIGELFSEECSDEVDRDLDLGGGHVLHRHGITLP
jgi:hypothetical protein